MSNIITTFKKAVLQSPEKIAVEQGNNRYTYRELDIESDKIADSLKNYYHIDADSCIAVYVSPSFHLISILLGIYKVGAYYLPLHDDFPISRKLRLISQASNKLVISDKVIENSPVPVITPQRLISQRPRICAPITGKFAYRIYTSGSTGTPKGVIVTQNNLDYIIQNLKQRFPMAGNDAYILSTPISFDVSVSELFSWLYSGARLVIPNVNDNKLLLASLGKEIIEHGVTHLALSPAILKVFIKLAKPKELRAINKQLKFLMVAGQKFPVGLANEVLSKLPDVRTFNLYGPTEATVYASAYEITHKLSKFVPIGRPLANAYIEKIDNKPISELVIYGSGISAGYWHQPEKNKESFISNNGKVGYRTGDLGEIMADGNVIYHGRIDNQVQINGIRVELGEIEAQIASIPGVDTVKVIYSKNKLLCFYSALYPIPKDILAKEIKEILPSYMVPHKYVLTNQFPINTNGKIDSAMLLATIKKTAPVTHTAEVSSKLVQQSLSALSSILGIKLSHISPDQNFFSELEMDSLSSVELIVNLEEILGVKLSLKDLHQHPTINSLVSSVNHSELNEMQESDSYKVLKRAVTRNLQYLNLFKSHSNTHTVPVGHYQKNYLKEGFDSSLSFIQEDLKPKDMLHIRKNMSVVLRVSDSLQSTLSNHMSPNLSTTLDFQQFDIPTVYVPFTSVNLQNDLDDICAQSYLINRFNAPLFRAMFFVDNTGIVSFFMSVSHMIADLGALNLLERELDGDATNLKSGYLNYLEFLQAHTNLESYRATSLNKIFTNADEENRPFSTISDGLFISNLGAFPTDLHNTETIIPTACFRLGKLIARTCKLSRVTMSTLFNIKKFDAHDFRNIIGDFHESFPLTYSQDMNLDSFLLESQKLLNVMRTGNLVQNALDLTNNSAIKSRFKQIQNAKVDFIGTMLNENINTLYDNAFWFINHQQRWISENRLRVTLFIYDNKLYCLWLNQTNDLFDSLKHLQVPTFKLRK